jgi:lipoate-protein ligase A
MRAALALDRARARIKQVWITGDFFVKPARIVVDLEANLRDTPVAELEHNIEHFFRGNRAEMLMLQPEDFLTVIRNALAKTTIAGHPSGNQPA